MSPAAALTDRKSSTRQKIYKIVASGILPQVWLTVRWQQQCVWYSVRRHYLAIRVEKMWVIYVDYEYLAYSQQIDCLN